MTTAALFLVTACATQPVDTRLGENGRVRFVGGGCSGTTAMAVGSREILTLEPVDTEELPAELDVSATKPSVITASAVGPDKVLLQAHAAGESRVELTTSLGLFDALTFSAEPAAAVSFQAAARVLAGGTLEVVVGEVFGSCKTSDCPLFGHSFLSWKGEPSAGLVLLADEGGTARFRAGEAQKVTLEAREPAVNAQLVAHELEVVSAAGFTGLAAELTTIPLEDDEVAETVTLPGDVSRGKVFCVRVSALLAEGPSVVLSRHDVRWRIDGDSVVPLAMDHAGEPFGTVFLATETLGSAVLTAEVDLLDADATFELIVK